MGTSNSISKNFRVYYLAFIVYWGIVLFGYDTGIAGGVVSQPYFQKHFGLLHSDGSKNQRRIDEVSGNIVSVLQAGAFVGALVSAPLSARSGRKPTLILFTSVFAAGAVLTVIANGSERGLQLIYSGRVISGFGIGGISAVAPAFVSECSPKEVRGRITGLFQIMVATGVMISYFINYGVGIHQPDSPNIWRVPFGFQLVPAGITLLGLFTIKESPRWLLSVERADEAHDNLCYFRKEPKTSPAILEEFTEMEATIYEERKLRQGLRWKEAFLGKGNLVRFVIAFFIFLLQQWGGQNSIGYYAPQIFQSIGYTSQKSSLLASGIYGVVKVIATTIFVFFGVETLGRRHSLIISSVGMGILFFVIGAILKTHPPNTHTTHPSPASQVMAILLYIYVCFYSSGWGPLPWVYVSDIFPTRTRHYGLATASSSQWLWNFAVSKVTPELITNLGYKIFFLFGTINIGLMATFAYFIPETKGRSLEEMDIIFGAVTKEERHARIIQIEEATNSHPQPPHSTLGIDDKD